MDRKKLIIIILVLILLVVSAVLLTIKLFDLENETVKTSTENVIENSMVNNTIQNEVSNNVVNNTVQNNVNNVVKNEINNITTNTKKEEEKKDTQTNEEKAVSIVEKIWRNEKNVYCSFEEIDSEGNYIVCVRNKETTKALYWYTVNIETGKATIK